MIWEIAAAVLICHFCSKLAALSLRANQKCDKREAKKAMITMILRTKMISRFSLSESGSEEGACSKAGDGDVDGKNNR